MTYYLLKSTPQLNSFVLYNSNYNYTPTTFTDLQLSTRSQSRSQSILGTDDYLRSLRRSFSRSKLLAFFNPDLTQFITLTYRSNTNTPQQVQYDIKQLLKTTNRALAKSSGAEKLSKLDIVPKIETSPDIFSTNPQSELTLQVHRDCGSVRKNKNSSLDLAKGNKNKNRIKYIYILERQKRGSIHVHLISSLGFRYYTNKNGYLSLTDWKHGFSSVKTIDDFDKNFKPYLYLFKYMYKTERVGNSFVHTSRNFDKITNVDYDKYISKLKGENLLFEEDYNFKVNDKDYTIKKTYYKE